MQNSPPWIWAGLVCLANARHCGMCQAWSIHVSAQQKDVDHTGERYLHINIPYWGTIIGFIMALASFKTSTRYVSMFFMASGGAGQLFHV